MPGSVMSGGSGQDGRKGKREESYIARAVILHLLESTNRFSCDADRRSDNARAKGRVGCPARQVVLQHVAVRRTGSVGRHSKTPGREARRRHQQQQQHVSNDRDATGLADGQAVGRRMGGVQPDCSVEANGGDDECKGVEEAKVHGGRACFRVVVAAAAALVVQRESMCDGGGRRAFGLLSDACGGGCLGDCKAEDSGKEEGEGASGRSLARSTTGAAANE
jgi:hypothetical protein